MLLHLLSAPGWAGEAVPAPESPATPAPTSASPPAVAPTPQGAFVGQPVPVNHVAAAELKKVLQPLGTSGGAVLEQPGGKSLMIVDTPENTRRLLEIKELIDVPALASARFDIYEPKGAAAEELSTAINDLVRSGIIPVEPPQSLALAPLPRGNRILAVSKIDSGLSEARRWLERLDRRAVRPRRIYLYPLQASDKAKAENAIAAWVASRQGNPPLRASKPVARIDPPTTCLVFYGTAEEFQELKDVIDPDARVADFKQRLASIEQMFKSEAKAQKSESKTEPKTQKRPL